MKQINLIFAIKIVLCWSAQTFANCPGVSCRPPRNGVCPSLHLPGAMLYAPGMPSDLSCVKFAIPETGVPDVPLRFSVTKDGRSRDQVIQNAARAIQREERVSAECAREVATATERFDECNRMLPPTCSGAVRTSQLNAQCARAILNSRLIANNVNAFVMRCGEGEGAVQTLALETPKRLRDGTVLREARAMPVTCDATISGDSLSINTFGICPPGLGYIACVNDSAFSEAEMDRLSSLAEQRASGQIVQQLPPAENRPPGQRSRRSTTAP